MATATVPLNPSVAAIVNGTIISREDYDEQIAQAQVYFLKKPGLKADSMAGREALRHLQAQVLDWMIDQVLIEQAALSHGIVISEATIDAQVSRMRGQDEARFSKWLAASGLSVESLRQQLRMDLLTAAMRDRVTVKLPRKVMQIHVRHILLSEESAAREVLRQLGQGGNLIALARQFSEDEMTRNSGGDLGFLPKGVMPPTFESAAWALKPGEISDMVRSESGFHIIQLVEIDPERQVPDDIWPMVQERAFEDWLAEQRALADIQRSVDLRPR